MKKGSTGSSLVMVMCFTSAVAIALLGVWQSSLYMVEAAHARTGYIKILKSTEGLLNVAIELGIENYEQLMQSQQEIVIEFPAWLVCQGASYQGIVRLQGEKDYVTLHATVKNHTKTAQALRCRLAKGSGNQFEVAGWSKVSQS